MGTGQVDTGQIDTGQLGTGIIRRRAKSTPGISIQKRTLKSFPSINRLEISIFEYINEIFYQSVDAFKNLTEILILFILFNRIHATKVERITSWKLRHCSDYFYSFSIGIMFIVVLTVFFLLKFNGRV